MDAHMKKLIDSIKANIDEIYDYFDDEHDDTRFVYCAQLADSIATSATQIAEDCRIREAKRQYIIKVTAGV